VSTLTDSPEYVYRVRAVNRWTKNAGAFLSFRQAVQRMAYHKGLNRRNYEPPEFVIERAPIGQWETISEDTFRTRAGK
jgi:hypothetical protein